MWFKQVQIWQLATLIYDAEVLEQQLSNLAFQPCLPSLPSSYGWVSPLGQDHAPLVHVANGYMLLCMQIEEKILPATVVNQALQEKIKTIQTQQDRKVGKKEKYELKDEITQNLLPRAFSKFTQIYAYLDLKNAWLVIGSNVTAKCEKFLELFKRSQNDFIPQAVNVKRMGPILSHWLLHDNSPDALVIEKSCVLIDPKQQTRVIRCQEQDLYAAGILSLLKEGCEVFQLSLSWYDKISFTLVEDFSLKNIKYQDAVLGLAKDQYGESAAQRLDADFVIMTETLSGLLMLLSELFVKQEAQNNQLLTQIGLEVASEIA